VPISLNTLTGYQKSFNWYPFQFSENPVLTHLGESGRAGSQKGYHFMWKPPVLIVRIREKTLKVLTEKVRTAQHWWILHLLLNWESAHPSYPVHKCIGPILHLLLEREEQILHL
jgi:hypothetical protein